MLLKMQIQPIYYNTLPMEKKKTVLKVNGEIVRNVTPVTRGWVGAWIAMFKIEGYTYTLLWTQFRT